MKHSLNQSQQALLTSDENGQFIDEAPMPPRIPSSLEAANIGGLEDLPSNPIKPTIMSQSKPDFERLRTITLSFHVPGAFGEYRKWLLPWAACSSWEEFKSTLQHVFSKNPGATDCLENYTFSLEDPYGVTILPQFWEMIVVPHMLIFIKFQFSPQFDQNTGDWKEQTSPPDDSKLQTLPEETIDDENEEASETQYVPKIRYTVRFCRKNEFGSGDHPPIFERERHFDEPILFDHSQKRAKVLHVLQETVQLIRSPQSGISYGYPALAGGATEDPESRYKKPEALMPGDKIGTKTLTINSPFLLNALQTVIAYSSRAPTGNEDPLKGGTFPYPYADLYHYKEALLEYRNKPNATKERHSDEYNVECDQHIDILIQYLYDEETIRLKKVEDGWKEKIPVTSFGSLWLLLRSGSDVYVKECGFMNAYVIESFVGGVQTNGIVSNYKIYLWNLAYDGASITRRSMVVEVPVFDGEREIASLPLVPCQFYQEQSNSQTLRESLIERGKKYLQLARGPAFREYSGVGLESGSRTYEHSRVVIDYKSEDASASSQTLYSNPSKVVSYDYNPTTGQRPDGIGIRARSPGCQCDKCKIYNTDNQIYLQLTYGSYDDINPRSTETLSDHQYFLCDSHLWGYILKERKYDQLQVRNIVEPKINIHAIDKLVMKMESNKETMKAICQAYSLADASDKPFFADIIQGKGEGQIILLHGPPGTGKTLTAESVAEFTKRPLLSITAADLGHDPKVLEQRLLTFFRNANKWGAIVLLDEADVYLERRDTHDLRRNSIVSIFLRALDYFQGLFFLTTNRVGSFDEAFISRIHIQIGYDPLDDDARSKIWDNSFAKLKEDHELGEREIHYDWDAKEYVKRSKEVRELQWNGREIRNAFQTAVALALYDAKGKQIPKVTESHLQKVVAMSRVFKNYMKSTHEDMDESEIAFKRGLRHDEFGEDGFGGKEIAGNTRSAPRR